MIQKAFYRATCPMPACGDNFVVEYDDGSDRELVFTKTPAGFGKGIGHELFIAGSNRQGAIMRDAAPISPHPTPSGSWCQAR